MEPAPDYLPLLIAAGGAVIGTIFFFVGRHLRRDERDLRGGLHTARATISEKLRKRGAGSWGGLENYFLRVRFMDESQQPRESELHVQSSAWRMLREGGVISVNYPPGHPEQARFGSRFAMRVRRAIGTLLMIGGPAAAVFFLIGALAEFLKGSQM